MSSSRLVTWLESVEADWLGWSLPPPYRALAEAGWRPDPVSAYCGRCGVSAHPVETGTEGCGSCRGRPVVTGGVVRLGAYAGPLGEWVRAIKYRRWSAMARLLGHALGRQVACHGPAGRNWVVVPMPMPWARRLYRGIDHAREIAQAVARELDAPLAAALIRDDSPPQVTLTAAARARGGAGVRLGRGCRRVGSRRIVLVDDVCTTGASLRRAVGELRHLGPRAIMAAVVAVADPPDRRGATPYNRLA